MGLKCLIVVDRTNDGVYRSNEPVTGTVKYNIDDTTRFEAINISLKGNLEATEDSLIKEQFVFLRENILKCKDNIVISGEYKEPFEFILPEDLPSSFKDSICAITYKIEVEFVTRDPSCKFPDSSTFEKTITVYGNVKPYPDVQHQSLGLTKSPFSSDKPMDLDIEIEKALLEPGESIKLKYLICNETNVPVSGITTKLIVETTYQYDIKNKKMKRKIINESIVESPGAKENSEVKQFCIVPTLPNLYSIQNSKCLTRDYKVSVTASFPFPHRDVSVEIPIVIGGGISPFQMYRIL